MLIIISGCDRTGKSTLAEILSERLKAQYIHFSYPKDKLSARREYFNFLECIDADKYYICDRFYEGEFIYAPIYRGYKLDYSREIERKILEKTNCLFIYIYADNDIILNRIKKCGEDYININDLNIIINGYNQFLKQLMMPYIALQNNDLYDKINNVQKCLKCIKYTDNILSYHRNKSLPLPFGNLYASKISYYNDENHIDNIYNNNMWFTCKSAVTYDVNILSKISQEPLFPNDKK